MSACACKIPGRISDPVKHAQWHELLLEQTGLDAVDERTLRELRGSHSTPMAVRATPVAPRKELPLEWRRRAWQVIRALAGGGVRFGVADVLGLTGPAPDSDGALTVESLLMTATHDHQTLSRLPTGEWIGR